MPTYTYKCDTCHHVWDELLDLGADAVECPNCGNPEPRKVMGSPAVHFKGTGFYTTDYVRGRKQGARKDQ